MLLLLSCSAFFFIPGNSHAQVLDKKDTCDIRFVNSRKFYLYKVNKGETLFSISQKFNIPQEEIHQFNPELQQDGLKAKMKLWIPAYSWLEKDVVKTEEKVIEKVAPVSHEFKLTLFTKLNLDRIYLPGEVQDSSYVSEPLDPELEANLQFYEGVQSALVRLKGRGLKAHLTVYDTEEDSSRLNKLMFKPELPEQHLLFTNLSGRELKKLNDFSLTKKLPLLATAINVTDQVKFNPEAIALYPSSLLQCSIMGKRASGIYNDANCVVVRTGQAKENERSATFAQGWVANKPGIKIRFADYGKYQFKGIQDSLVKGKMNVIFIPSSNEDQVSTIFNALKEVLATYTVTVIGLPTWQHFETIDPALFDTFQVVLFNAGFIDYKARETEEFRRYFRDTYNSEPGEPAYQGYDAMLVAGELYLSNRLNSAADKPREKIDGLYSDYDFYITDGGLCRENKILHFLQFNDFIPDLIRE